MMSKREKEKRRRKKKEKGRGCCELPHHQASLSLSCALIFPFFCLLWLSSVEIKKKKKKMSQKKKKK